MADKENKYLGLSEDERNSELKLLKASWEMYEKTKQETEFKRKNAVDKSGKKKYSEESTKKTLQLLETMQADIVRKYIALGGSKEDLVSKKRGRKANLDKDRMKKFAEILEREKQAAMNKPENTEDVEEDPPVDLSYFTNDEDDSDKIGTSVIVSDPLYNLPIIEDDGETVDEAKEQEEETVPEVKEEEGPKFSIDITKAMGNNIKYDIIPLPSKGQAYKNKMGKIPVSYLTAYDENMIISPNMYKDGTFLDYMLKAKIMTNEIDPMDLLPGDRDAIILWLRASGYGNDFPVSATDPVTGQRFDATIDLTKLNFKKFKLKGDANGYFSFKLPVTKDDIKFKFLTYGDVKKLNKLEEDELVSIRRSKYSELADSLEDAMEREEDIPMEMKLNLNTAIKHIREFSDAVTGGDEENLYTHAVTNRLAASIVSINGVTDRKYIEEYVMYMNVRDSSALRKYIVDNEPGVDFNIEVVRPESLGGGSVNMFLSIDQYIFLTLT